MEKDYDVSVHFKWTPKLLLGTARLGSVLFIVYYGSSSGASEQSRKVIKQEVIKKCFRKLRYRLLLREVFLITTRKVQHFGLNLITIKIRNVVL